jgi:hypothetical protein
MTRKPPKTLEDEKAARSDPILGRCAYTVPNTVFLYYRGFKRNGGCVLGYNIIVVPHLRYGLKRCSGTFGSILDLNEGVVQ